MNNAPLGDAIVGREGDLESLCALILDSHCRLIFLRGMGGVGKSVLAASLARRIAGETRHEEALTLEAQPRVFDRVIWQSTLNAPRFDHFMTEVIYLLSGNALLASDLTAGQIIDEFIRELSRSPALIVIDNFESLLSTDGGGIEFKYGFEPYGELLRRVAEEDHLSCVFANGRELPSELERLFLPAGPAHLYALHGLDIEAGKLLIDRMGLHSTEESAKSELINQYRGNPLAINLSVKYIQEVYSGRIGLFLRSDRGLFKDIRQVLNWHFGRLNEAEILLVFILAANRETTSLEELRRAFAIADPGLSVGDTVQSLGRKMPIERLEDRFSLQPVLLEHAASQLITVISEEILTGGLKLIDRVCLFDARSKDYIRTAQAELILEPILNKVRHAKFRQEMVQDCLSGAVSKAREDGLRGYAAGNVINALLQGDFSIAGMDCSRLTIRAAHFQNVDLFQTDFSESCLIGCVFSTTLGSVLDVEFSPSGDRLATGDTNGEIAIWNSRDGSKIATLEGHASWCRSVTFSPDGTLLASGSSDYSAKVWDLESRECVATLRGHTDQIYSVAFSPSGDLVATGGEDQLCLIWRVSDGMLLATLEMPTGRVRSVAFAPDGDAIAVAAEGVTLWDVDSGTASRHIRVGGRYTRQVLFSPDGQRLICVSEDGPILVVDIRSEQNSIEIEKSERIRCVDFNAEAQLIVGAGDSGKIHFWRADTGELIDEIMGHGAPVKAVAFGPGAELVASGSDDQSVKIWDSVRQQCLRTIRGCPSAIRAVAFDAVSNTILSGGEDGKLRLWRCQIDSIEESLTLQAHAGTIQAVACEPRGRLMGSGGNDGAVRIWDTASGRCLHTLRGHSSWVWNVAFAADGKFIASAGRDYLIRIWCTSTGSLVRTLAGHTDEVHSVVFIDDGNGLASASDDNTIIIWDTRSGATIARLEGHRNCVRSLAYAPGRGLLASASDDQTVKIWDLKRRSLLRSLSGHSARVRSVVFSPDELMLYSSSDDKTIRTWSTDDGVCTETLAGHDRAIWSIARLGDGVVSGSEDGTIRIWKERKPATRILRPRRLYEGANISGATGLGSAETAALKRLGATTARMAAATASVRAEETGHPIVEQQRLALVMKGGGIKALAYVGAVGELEKHFEFDWYAGTSAGGLLAILLGAGYSSSELSEIIRDTDFRRFLDAKPLKMLTTFYKTRGLFPGDALTAWVDRLLAAKLRSRTRVTMGMLPRRATVYASRRNKNALVFDSRDPKSDHIYAAHAVRCSIAIPFIFSPQSDQGMTVLDGGLRNNFPLDLIKAASPETDVVGLYLGPELYEGEDRPRGMIRDLISILIEAKDGDLLERYHDKIVMVDPRPISLLNFGVSMAEKEFLLKSGQVGALRYLRRRGMI